MSGEAIRVAIVDDQPLFVSGIRMLLESQPDLVVVGQAGDGEAAVEMVLDALPDIVLMDIRMPGLDGIGATARILAEPEASAVRIIMLTTFRRDEAVFRAIRAGAAGFLTKAATPEYVLEAIRTVHEGASVLGPKATFELVAEYAGQDGRNDDRPETALAPLSAREREIFLLAAKGLSNAEIATAAFVSEATAKTHIRSILSKLGLYSRVQIVIHAYENGLLPVRAG